MSLAYKERNSQDLLLLPKDWKSIRKKLRLSRSGRFLPISNASKDSWAFITSLNGLYETSLIRHDHQLSLLRKIRLSFRTITIKKRSKSYGNYLLPHQFFDTSIDRKKSSQKQTYRTIYLAEYYYSTVKIVFYILSFSIIRRYCPLNITIIFTIRNYQLLLDTLKTRGQNQK